MPAKLRRYAYACVLESWNRCAKAPTHATTYSILSNISFLSIAICNAYYPMQSYKLNIFTLPIS